MEHLIKRVSRSRKKKNSSWSLELEGGSGGGGNETSLFISVKQVLLEASNSKFVGAPWNPCPRNSVYSPVCV